jgi:hypothetical protein
MTAHSNESLVEHYIQLAHHFVFAGTGEFKDEVGILSVLHTSLDEALAGVNGSIPAYQSDLKRLLAPRFPKETEVVNGNAYFEESTAEIPEQSDRLRSISGECYMDECRTVTFHPPF